jgi:hypothetical protein
MPTPAHSDLDSPNARADRALALLAACGPIGWFAAFLAAYALSPRACTSSAAWVALVAVMGASAAGSALATRACVRRVRGGALTTVRGFAVTCGLALNAFSLLLTLGLFAALYTGARCD